MNLPFTHAQFFEVMARYNDALFPLQAGLVLLALVAYGAMVVLGREFPEIPTFGVPCPTTIFTIGMLAFLSAPLPRYVFAIPIAWAFIGAQAAFLLGMYEDLGLLAAGLAGIWLAFDPPARTRPA